MTASPFGGHLTECFPLLAARAYYLSSSQDPENLTRAEAALQELIATTENQVPEFTFWMDLNCFF